MSHLRTKVAEYGIIINEKKEFLILQFSKDEVANESWILPGGRLEEDDQPKTGLVREIKEEANLNVEIISPCDVSMWGKGELKRYAVFFICKLKGNSNIKLSHEHQNFRWCSFEDIFDIDYYDGSIKAAIEQAKKQLRINSQPHT